MVARVCPSREILLQYSLGFLSGGQQDALDSHLDGCRDCQTTIMSLDDTNDRLLGLLRMPLSSESVLTEPQLQDALTAAMAIPARMRSGKQGSGFARRLASDMPEALGEYRVLEELGRGGMGRVYKALHTKLDRVVAVKVLSRDCVVDQTAMVRFEHEMKAVGRVAHLNIVQAYDAREIDGTPVLIMEFVDGLDLAEIVRRLGLFPVADACELVRQIALALQCAHEHGMVHRDVKPSNIMLARSGEVKLLDLGLARLCAKDGTDDSQRSAGEAITATGQAMGTADYMAPEQASDSGTVDIRADLYSLGCTLYKLLSGRAPFSGSHYRTTFAKLNAHVHQSAPSIRRLVPGVPDQVAAILDRLLAKSPAARFSTPAELSEALAPCCVGADLPALLGQALGAERQPEIDPLGSQPSRTTQTVATPPVLLVSWGWKWFAGLLILLMMVGGFGVALGIIIRIQKDGKETAFEVPEGTSARITSDGRVEVTLPGQTKGPQEAERKPSSVSPSAEAWALVGPWRVVSIEKGKKADAFWNPVLSDVKQGGSFAAFDRLTFDERGGVTFSDLKTGRNCRLAASIDPTATPHAMDLARKGQTGEGSKDSPILGIYELEGDRLNIRWTICLPWMRSGQRPVNFTVDANSADLSLVLRRPVQEQAVQGGWSAVRQIADGKEVSDPHLGLFVRDPSLGPSLVLELTPDGIGRSRAIARGRCVLDVGKEPKWLTIFSQGSADPADKRQEWMGIYKLEDKQLHLAYRMSGPRPEQFASQPGSGVTLLVLERPKPTATATLPGRTKSGEHAEAIAEIEKLGGKVTVDETSPDKAATSVVLMGWFVTDDVLGHLEGLTSLRLLDLTYSEVTDAGLEHLQGLTQLETLHLRNTEVGDAGLEHLQGLTNLRTLSLMDTKVTDVGLEYLQGLAKLHWLCLRNTQVTDAGLDRLKGLTNLQALELWKTKVTDAGLEHLQGLTNLQTLNLANIEVADAGLKHLKGLTNLHDLSLWRTKVSDAGLDCLKGLTNLQTLNLGYTQVTDAGLEHLQGLTDLRLLNLSDTEVTDAGLERLKGLTNLHWLSLRETKVSDAGLEHLKGLTKLETLNLEQTKVTDAGVKRVQQALPKCAISH